MIGWSYIFLFAIFAIIIFIFVWGEILHRQDVDEIHRQYRKEREMLLDRIMANNIHEFKSASGNLEVKQSETGNFLKDQMNKTAKQFMDLE